MRMVLDTHMFLWFVPGDMQLSPHARALIENLGDEKLISRAGKSRSKSALASTHWQSRTKRSWIEASIRMVSSSCPSNLGTQPLWRP